MASLITRFTSPTLTATADIAILDIDNYKGLSYQANVGGNLAGTLELWVSNDKQNFIHKSDADKAILGGTNYMIEVPDLFTAYVKFVANVSSGSGVITVIPCAKE